MAKRLCARVSKTSGNTSNRRVTAVAQELCESMTAKEEGPKECGGRLDQVHRQPHIMVYEKIPIATMGESFQVIKIQRGQSNPYGPVVYIYEIQLKITNLGKSA